MAEVAAAVNDAPDGHLIDGLAERCRDAPGEFGRLAYEAAVPTRVEATEANPSFSPGGRARHGRASRTVPTGCGRARVSRRRYATAAGGGGRTDAPVDDLVDLAHAGVSLAVREMCGRLACDAASFARAAANLGRVAQLELSDETLRQLVEADGRAAVAWQDDGQLELDFDAAACVTDRTAGGTPASRAYVGIDGFMVPVVTDAEAGKRFEAAKARRKARKRRKGVRRPRLVRRAGADGPYKELKLVTLYDQGQTRRLTRVTRHGPARAARMLSGMAEDVRLGRADQVVAVTDGAEWIAGLVDRVLPAGRTTAILDFYHAAQHVHAAGRAAFGEAGGAGKTWAAGVIEALLNRPFDEWWGHLVTTRARLRAPAKRAALDGLMQYLAGRRGKVDYPRFRAAGMSIGSGPTESACKSHARRLKGAGMRWTAANAEAMAALESLHQSNLWAGYWKSRLSSAA